MRTLVIAPHMDDEVLGAGGLIRKRVCCGDEVMVMAVFGRKYPPMPGGNEEVVKRQRYHMEHAAQALGYKTSLALELEEGEPAKVGHYRLLDQIENTLRQFEPDEVVIPGRDDLNQDHRHLNEVCRIALRAGNRNHDKQTPIRRVLEMIGHDLLLHPQVNYAVALTPQIVDTVIKAWSCYTDEQRAHPHPRSKSHMISRYQYWGGQFGYELAEPYRLLFEVE